MPSYIATYIVDKNNISVQVNGAALLNTFIGEKVYLYISTGDTTYAIIDLSKYMLYQADINYTSTLTTLVASLTNLQITSYTSQDIPLPDPNTGGFEHRLNVYDPYITSDVTVSWTSIETPDIRNDVYQRDALNDLVISSTKKDFSNCFASVNGVIHKTYFFNNELYVKGGFYNIKTTRENKIAIYDTSSLGGHVVLPITKDNIDTTNTDLFSGVTLTFPNTDFTGTTVLLVLGGYLYVLDDTYRLINNNRIRIDTCKIDFITQFLHNPNTSYIVDNFDQVAADITSSVVPTVTDEITYYLTSVYSNALTNPAGSVNFLSFDAYEQQVPPQITPVDMINKFLSAYPVTIPNGASVMVSQYQKYVRPTSIVGSMESSILIDQNYIKTILSMYASFLIVIKNPQVYVKTYDLYRTQVPSQYISFGSDTPRGILQYNKYWTFPYLGFTEADNNYHNFSIGYSKIFKDVYKTSINPQYIPSPAVDVKYDTDYPVKLIELFSV